MDREKLLHLGHVVVICVHYDTHGFQVEFFFHRLQMNENENDDIVAKLILVAQSGDVDAIRRLVRSMDQFSELLESERQFMEAFCLIVLGGTDERISSLLRETFRVTTASSFGLIAYRMRLVICVSFERETIRDACCDSISDLLSIPSLPSLIRADLLELLGWVNLIRSDNESALDLFTRSVSCNPSSGFALLCLVRCKAKLGRKEEAEEQFELITQTHPEIRKESLFFLVASEISGDLDCIDSGFFLHMKAMESMDKSSFDYSIQLNPLLLMEFGNRITTERAVRAMEYILSVFPRSAPAILSLADCRMRQGKRDEAKEMLRSIMVTNSEAAMKLARELESEGRVADALEILDLSSVGNREIGENFYYGLLRAKNILPQFRLAIPILTESLANGVGSASDKLELVLRLSHCFLETGQDRSALTLLEKSKAEWPPSEDRLRLAISTVLLKQGKFDSALLELEDVSKQCLEAISLRLDIHKVQGNVKAYIRTLVEAVGVAEWRYIGDKYLAIGEVDEAITCYEHDGSAQKQLVDALMLAHRYDEAEKLIRSGAHSECISVLIELLVGRENFSGALDYLSEHSDSRPWRLIVAVVQAAWKSTGDSLWLHRGVGLLDSRSESVSSDEQSEISGIRGEWFIHLNDCDNAFIEFDDSLKLNPSNNRALLGIAQVFFRRGQLEAAREYAGRISSDFKEEAEIFLSSIELPRDDSDRIPLVLTPSWIATYRYEQVIADYRCGKRTSIEASEGGDDAIVAAAVAESLYGKDVCVIRSFARKCQSSKWRDVILFRAIHVLLFERNEAQEAKQIFGELSFNANACDEFKLFNALLNNTDTPVGLPTLYQSFLDSAKSKKLKSILKRVFENIIKKSVSFSLSELAIVEVVLDKLSSIRIHRKEFYKAVPVCEYWCALVGGNPLAWSRLGLVYLRVGLVSDAVQALEKAAPSDALCEGYSKSGNHLKLISLMIDFPELMNKDQFKTSFYSL